MPLRPADLADALVTLDSPTPLTFATLCEEIHARQYTGPLIVHFRRGVPQVLEFPSSVKLTLDVKNGHNGEGA